MFAVVSAGLKKHFNERLVDELLAAYQEAKRNYYLGGLRLSEVEGGRFCEAAFRLLEQATSGKYLPLGRKLDIDALIQRLANLPKSSNSDSIRLHIPRALRVVYDVRNNRDAAHLADGIDPNIQDATLVVSVLDWVLAEFVRIYHNVSANEAQRMVEEIVSRKVPAVEDFNGFLKVLNPRLGVTDRVLLLLYQRGRAGATYEDLERWVHPRMRTNLRRTLARLVDDFAFVHQDGQRFAVSRTGIAEVERRKLVDISG